MVFRPPGAGRHPVVVVLHGSSGLAMVQLAWARRLADAGFVVLAGCYLDVAPSARVSSPDGWVRCAGLPDAAHSSAAGITRAYDALLDTATSLPGVEPGVLGVIGVSYGGIVALSTREPRVRAIVADSGYGKAGPSIVTAPVLLLGMTDDPNVSHADVVGFERALRAAGKGVEAHYYSGTGHVATLDPAVAADATNRAIAFFTRNLR